MEKYVFKLKSRDIIWVGCRPVDLQQLIAEKREEAKRLKEACHAQENPT